MKVYLNKLELHGFKSFPEKTVIKFHKGITTIIGPNGCGKSNIVDALLWVLGEQRIKNLRGENNEDLIFSGSVSKKPLGMTEVGAYFTGDNEETYIARRFFRTGDGKYILNEKYCRNRDIQDQLYKLNMGGRNYFIFEQGSIEKLVSLKPFERRLLIEEAAGISQYLVRKKETTNKLLIAQQNLDNIEILTYDKEQRLKELKNQVNYVARYRNIKSESFKYIKTYLSKKHSFLKKDFEEKKGVVEKKLNEEMILVKNISGNEKSYTEAETKKWELDQQLKKFQKDLYDLNKQLISDKGEIEKLRQENSFLKTHKKENTGLISVGKNELNSSNSIYIDIDKRVEAIEKEYKEEKTVYEKALEIRTALEKNIKDLGKKRESVEKSMFDVRSKISMYDSEIYENEKRIFKLENEIKSEKNSVTSMKSEIDEDAIASEKKNLSLVEEKMKDLQKIADESLLSVKDSKKRLEDTLFEIKEMKGESDILKNQREKYLQMKDKLGLQDSQNNTDEFWLLQDLIKSDRKDNKIIENFYFDEISALIPKKVTDILTSNKNRFYIPSDKKETLPNSIRSESGFVGFVKDLFNTEKRDVRDSLKEGVIVKTLKDGLDIFVRYRVPVVSLSAEVITAEGVVFKKRSVGVLDLIDEIKKIDERRLQLKKNIDQKENSLDMLRADLDDKEKRSELHEQEKEKLGKKLFQGKLTLKNFINIKENRTKRIEYIGKNFEEKKGRLKTIIDKNKDLKAEKNKSKVAESLFEKQIKELNSVEEKNREDSAEKEKIFWQSENRLNLIKEKKSGLEKEKRRLENERVKVEESISKYEKEIVADDSRIGAISKKISDLKSSHDEGFAKTGELEVFIRGREKELQEINENIKNLSETLTIQRKALNELKEQKSSGEIELASIRKDIFALEEVSFKELNMELSKVDADEELIEFTIEQLEQEADTIKERLNKMRDSNRLNFSAESEYELLEKDYGTLVSQKEDVVESIENMTEAIKKIDEESKENFMIAFNKINENFKRNFQILFEGGEAELSLLDKNDILETGLEIMAQPPGKKLQNLRLLSGGEKTLTSLAFLFALFEYRPSPFCVFDEVDASLDEANIQRFLKFLHKLKENTQFLIITHNFKTMEEADFIYGISMNEPGISTIYSMKMNPGNGFPLR